MSKRTTDFFLYVQTQQKSFINVLTKKANTMNIMYITMDTIEDSTSGYPLICKSASEFCVIKITISYSVSIARRIKDFPEDNVDGVNGKKLLLNKDIAVEGLDAGNGNENNAFRKITRNQKRRHNEINHVQKVTRITLSKNIFISPNNDD